MRDLITRTVSELSSPTVDERQATLSAERTHSAHDRFMAAWSVFDTIEVSQPATAAFADEFTVAAWNIERCKHVEASANLIRTVGADVILATEMDSGCVRSGQRHTTADLARNLDMGYAYGVEFVELGLGNDRETAECAGRENDLGLHGNAILSRFPLLRPALIPLDDGGRWYVNEPKGAGQVRIGGRMAMSAIVTIGSVEVVLVSVHYESDSTPEMRAGQTARLLQGIDTLYPGRDHIVIGGDLNTAGFQEARLPTGTLPDHPAQIEPSFDHFSKAGLTWLNGNTGAATTRLHPYDDPETPLKTIDWLFTRGLLVRDPKVHPALGPDGTVLSDHEMISARIEVAH